MAAKRRELRPLMETLSPETQALAAAILQPHFYQAAPASHTVTTPLGSFQVCRACYADCLRMYPGVNSIAPKAAAGRLDGRCQCEHDKHFFSEGEQCQPSRRS